MTLIVALSKIVPTEIGTLRIDPAGKVGIFFLLEALHHRNHRQAEGKYDDTEHESDCWFDVNMST